MSKTEYLIKPPLAPARAAWCCPSVRLSVYLSVCLSVAKIQKRDFLKKLKRHGVYPGRYSNRIQDSVLLSRHLLYILLTTVTFTDLSACTFVAAFNKLYCMMVCCSAVLMWRLKSKHCRNLKY